MTKKSLQGAGKHGHDLEPIFTKIIIIICFLPPFSSWELLLTLFPTSAIEFRKRLGDPREPSDQRKLFLHEAAKALRETSKQRQLGGKHLLRIIR